ncbi:oxidoreductase [Pseudorhodoferax aquiterrae]|uniref:Oxidoreductase n=1 Tax=Pseudorhodoferax aquiterrae TaxID=747304 RepID=A0ABQ3GEY6_9BURK|nr:SDR family NAD(P)-dependent oxidoreductase [Pseudorhodoferax aquiterrae]GHD03601.1 oxidoreductase [Pseudorhodoferax aquiterrae]
MQDLQGKAALVTGASTGIGAAVAEALGAHGVRVAVHYNQSREAAEAVAGRILAAGGRAVALRADVRDTAAIQACVAEATQALGAIDILINNAGSLVQRAPIAEFTDALFDEVLHVNALSALAFCRAVVPLMRQAGRGGSIINVTSVAARNGGGPGAYLYAGSKGFISTATRGLAKELVPDRIRVNAVAPGVIATPFQDRFSTAQMLENFRASIPMGRLGTAEECVGAFLYLASEQLSGYVTGQILEVNGGQYMP